MRGWGQRTGLAAATGAVAVALLIGMPASAFADDASSPPSPTTTTTDPTATTRAPEPSTTTTPSERDAPAASPAPPAVQLTPTLTATPATGLVNHQTVTLAGSGFPPGAAIGWAECKNGSSGQDDCDINNIGVATTDATGAFSASFGVRRILHTANGDFDCASAPEVCTVGAGVSVDTTVRAGAPISFDPTVPLPPPPTLLAAPTTDLVEGQTVAVFGGGFVPNGQVYLVQCLTPASAQTCQTLTSISADSAGGFVAGMTVHRVLAMPPFGTTDCATTSGICRLVAVSMSDYDFHADVPLDFDPSGPLLGGAVTVTPDTDLLNFQSVTVAGSGFATGDPIPAQLVQCKTGAMSYEDCSQAPSTDFAPITPAGTFSAAFSVRRILHLGGGDFDCGSAPAACSIVTSVFGGTPVVVATPISFDAGVPPPLPPTISVTPDTDLAPGQDVAVNGANFAPNSFVALGECLTGSGPVGYCPFGGAGVDTDANGSFTTTFTVRRGVPDFASYPPNVVDCASAPQRCSVTALSYLGADAASQPVDFDPSLPIDVPDVSVDPQFGLADRALVHVHSSGFVPGEEVLVSQCDADASNYPFSCSNGSSLDALMADANGEVDTFIRVHRTLTYNGGVVIIDDTANCAEAVGECVVRTQSIDDPLVMKDVPLGFDPTAVAPPPRLSTSPAGPYTDGEEVTVHGSGFTPHAVLGLAQCRSDVEPDGHTCDTQDGGLFDEFRADAEGNFSKTLTMHTQVQSTDSTIDCAPAGSCVLFAANREDYGAERVALPLGFIGGAAIAVAGATATRTLAFTGAGSRTIPMAISGAALLLVGGALVLLARRRRAA